MGMASSGRPSVLALDAAHRLQRTIRLATRRGGAGPNPKPMAERFWAKVDRSGDCWLWQGSRYTNGYGYFHVGGTTRGAHKVA